MSFIEYIFFNFSLEYGNVMYIDYELYLKNTFNADENRIQIKNMRCSKSKKSFHLPTCLYFELLLNCFVLPLNSLKTFSTVS